MPKINLKGLKGLKGLNQQPIPQDADLLTKLKIARRNGSTPESIINMFSAPAVSNIGQQIADINYGQSTYDTNATESQLSDLNEKRAIDQPWLAQFAAGVGKMVTTGVTAFVDGTAGLLLGTGEGLYGAFTGKKALDNWSKLFHNEISDGMNELNKYFEKVMPNYYTNEELYNRENGKWYNNLDTMNFWADGLIKNMGFTVAALYTGQVWNMALRGAGLLKNASTLGARITGSLLSAVNEGRVEANQQSTDMLNLRTAQIEDANNKRLSELNAYYKQKYNEIINSDMSSNQKNANLAMLNSDIAKRKADLEKIHRSLLQQAKDNANMAGIMDLALNIPLLAYNDFKTFGRMYASSFSAARQSATKTGVRGFLRQLNKGANEALAKEESELRNRITGTIGKYRWRDFTKKEALKNAGKIGLREGNEEMSQQFAANWSGEYFSPDSPDAYYKAMRNNKSNVDTQNLMESMIKGFASSYGDKSQWEQFAIGALNGMIGVPTFGKGANSTANTWLGRGKVIGISGGALGEYKTGNEINTQGKPIVDRMNKLSADIRDKKKLIAQSQSFINALNGYQEANNKFEYHNNEDNDVFNLFTSYLLAGKEDDLKSIISQEFENFTDKQLDDIKNIAGFTNEDWLDSDGNLTEDGKEQMKEKLIKRRDDMLNQFDKYKQALATVRNSSDIPKEHQDEMAWLLWKTKRFWDRIDDTTKTANKRYALNDVIIGIEQYTNSLRNEQAALKGDEIREETYTDENGKEKTRKINILEENKELVETWDSIYSLLKGVMEGNPNKIAILGNSKNKELFDKFLTDDFYKTFAEHSNVGYSNYKESLETLRDIGKMSAAAKQFDERLKEYIKNPNKINENHIKTDKEEEKKEEDKNRVTTIDHINNSDVSQVRTELDENGDFSAFDQILDVDESEQGKQAKQKVEAAKKINNDYNNTLQALNKQLQEGKISQDKYDIAKSMLDNSLNLANSSDELLDLDTEAFNNPDEIELSQEELQEWMSNSADETDLQQAARDLKQYKIDQAKNALEIAKQNKDIANQIREGMPSSEEIKNMPDATVGHDGTTITESTTEQQKKNQKEEKEKQNKLKKEQLEKSDILDIANNILEDVGITQESSNFDDLQMCLLRVLGVIDQFVKEGLKKNKDFSKNMFYSISNMESYKKLQQTIPTINNYLNEVYPYRQQEMAKRLQEEAKEREEDREYLRIGNEDNQTPIGEIAFTPDISTSSIPTVTLTRIDAKQKNETLGFWYPATTQYARFTLRNPTQYHNDKSLTNEQKQRYKTIWEFLNNKNVFENVKALQKGSKIHFAFSKELNENLKDMVVLMIDENGNIVGDLPTPYDVNFKKIKGLGELYNKAFQAAQNNRDNTEDIISIDDIETSVNKKMVGKPFYTGKDERMSVNNIFGDKESTFAIAMQDGEAQLVIEPGTSRYTDRSDRELHTISPLNAKKGQPYILIETSDPNRKYYPVPITMPKLQDNSLRETAIYKAIEETLRKLKGIKTQDEIVNVKDALQELLVLPILHINITDGKLKVDIQRPTDSHIMTIYNGDINADNIVDVIMGNLKGSGGTTFQVSRKYINTTYRGQSYNKMIGEIAQANLKQNATHTINDWFTINPIVDEKQVKAKNPKSIEMNPNHEDKQTFSMTNPNNGTTYTLDLVSKKLYDTTNGNNKELIGDMYNPIKSYMWLQHEKYTSATGIIKTPFGVYDIKNGKMVTNPMTEKSIDTISVLSGYFEGGGAKIENDYPNLTKEQIDWLEDYFMGYAYFTEQQAQEIIKNMNLVSPIREENQQSVELLTTKNIKVTIESGSGVQTYLDNNIPAIIGDPRVNKDKREIPQFYEKEENSKSITTITYQSKKFGVSRGAENGIAISFKGKLDETTKEKVKELIIKEPFTVSPEEAIKYGDTIIIVKKLIAIINQAISTPTRTTNNTNTKIQENPIRQQELKPQDVIDNIKNITKKRTSKKIQTILNNMEGNQEVLNLVYNANKLQLNLQLPKAEAVINLSMTKEQQAEKLKELFKGKVLNRESKGIETKKWNQRIEETKVYKMLPQLGREGAIRIVSSIKNMNGDTKIYGQFKNGVLYIAKDAARGTLYHEAFHYVTQSLLSNDELTNLYEQAKTKYGELNNIDLEEKMAEDFREYIQKEEGFKGIFVKVWRKLKNIINTIFNNQNTIDKLFYDISRGNYANRQEIENNIIFNSDELNKVKSKVQGIFDNYINSTTWNTKEGRRNAIRKILDNWEREGYKIKSYTRNNRTYVGSVVKINDNTIKNNNKNKNTYMNLSEEQKSYLNERNISPKNYNNMTEEEKETLFRCM